MNFGAEAMRQHYEEGGAVPHIRDAQHYNELLNGAEGDDDLMAIKAQADKQGIFTGGSTFKPGTLAKKRGGRITGKKAQKRLDRK